MMWSHPCIHDKLPSKSVKLQSHLQCSRGRGKGFPPDPGSPTWSLLNPTLDDLKGLAATRPFPLSLQVGHQGRGGTSEGSEGRGSLWWCCFQKGKEALDTAEAGGGGIKRRDCSCEPAQQASQGPVRNRLLSMWGGNHQVQLTRMLNWLVWLPCSKTIYKDKSRCQTATRSF